MFPGAYPIIIGVAGEVAEEEDDEDEKEEEE